MKAKYYEALAKSIKENIIPIVMEGSKSKDLDTIFRVNNYIYALCGILKAENPGFDENKFRELLK